jgi:hypothetical protein
MYWDFEDNRSLSRTSACSVFLMPGLMDVMHPTEPCCDLLRIVGVNQDGRFWFPRRAGKFQDGPARFTVRQRCKTAVSANGQHRGTLRRSRRSAVVTAVPSDERDTIVRSKDTLEFVLERLGSPWIGAEHPRSEMNSGRYQRGYYVVAHPVCGVALLLVGCGSFGWRRTASPVAAFRGFLEAQGFTSSFPGYLPVVALPAERLRGANPVAALAEAFANQPLLTIIEAGWPDALIATVRAPKEIANEARPTAPSKLSRETPPIDAACIGSASTDSSTSMPPDDPPEPFILVASKVPSQADGACEAIAPTPVLLPAGIAAVAAEPPLRVDPALRLEVRTGPPVRPFRIAAVCAIAVSAVIFLALSWNHVSPEKSGPQSLAGDAARQLAAPAFNATPPPAGIAAATPQSTPAPSAQPQLPEPSSSPGANAPIWDEQPGAEVANPAPTQVSAPPPKVETQQRHNLPASPRRTLVPPRSPSTICSDCPPVSVTDLPPLGAPTTRDISDSGN